MTGKNVLVAYSASFVSFLLDSDISKKIDGIVLFGSVARGDFDEESDIDLFVDTREEIEKEVGKMLSLFESSELAKRWRLKGVKNDISLKVGELKKWKLRRDVVSTGIQLYGKYNELPEEAKYLMLVRMSLEKIGPSKQMGIWRGLYGYKQRVGKKVYGSGGLVKRLGGKKLGKGIVIVPMERSKELVDFLNKNRIVYTLDELWSDTLAE